MQTPRYYRQRQLVVYVYGYVVFVLLYHDMLPPTAGSGESSDDRPMGHRLRLLFLPQRAYITTILP